MADDSARVRKGAALKLQTELKDLAKNVNSSFSLEKIVDDNVFKALFGPPDSYYENGLFRVEINFPPDYPNEPPELRFLSEIWHPNIYSDGKVCISILHTAGSDPSDYEKPEECWRPVLTAEAVLMSVISLLGNPNLESPANIDAANMYRNNQRQYVNKVQWCVEKTLEDL
ncbi:Ubiquitin-conjugating enzyme E2 14 [Coemansia sp. RSA 2049]|nr:Ubiquitin-conjugating enzyme E2 14 [Coemansia sp. RSA 2049]KAJ2611251.1 Ubiquitin-conjugating enzyme E2 14 [Coemansia sp. RSA 1804]